MGNPCSEESAGVSIPIVWRVSIVCPGLCSLDSPRAIDFVSIRKKSINLGFLCFLIPFVYF
jgi:hypothetical protein